MYGNHAVNRLLPNEADMNRDDALDAFLAVINTVRPDHPYHHDPYPLSRRDVEFGSTRTYYGRCGPNRHMKPVTYQTRMTYINRISRERHLALLTHEVTHVTYGGYSGDQHGSHAPEFWREMAFLATELRDALRDGALEPVFGEVDVGRYLRQVRADAGNGATVDQRYWSTTDCMNEVGRLIGIGPKQETAGD